MEEKREIRKYKDTLIVVGMGVVAFGLWSFIKTLAYTVFEKNEIMEIIYENTATMEDVSPEGIRMINIFIFVFLCVVLFGLIAADILLRIYIAKNARAEAFGTKMKKKNTYLVIAGIMALVSFFSMVYAPIYIIGGEGTDADSYLDMIANVLVEATSFITLMELIFSAVKIRQLRSVLKQRGLEEQV